MASDSVLSLFAAVFKKGKRDLSNDVQLLAVSVRTLASELTKLSNNFILLTKAIREHDDAINYLFAMQDTIMKATKSSGIDTAMPSLNRDKSNKTN